MQKEELIEEWKRSKFVNNQEVIRAFRKVKRENFVLPDYNNNAYLDEALPILGGQTISQPSTVVCMLDNLELEKGLKVLEIGTGSGYNAALISMVIKPGVIYTVELVDEVYNFAKENLKGFDNIIIVKCDGSEGLKKFMPYDRIIVTAACPEIPMNLVNQLKINGILVAPVGKYDQDMIKLVKTTSGNKIENLGKFVFVKLKGKFGFK